MFKLRNFIMKTLLESIGKEPDYKIRDNALGWYDKSKLTEDDLAEIEAAITEYRTTTDGSE